MHKIIRLGDGQGQRAPHLFTARLRLNPPVTEAAMAEREPWGLREQNSNSKAPLIMEPTVIKPGFHHGQLYSQHKAQKCPKTRVPSPQSLHLLERKQLRDISDCHLQSQIWAESSSLSPEGHMKQQAAWGRPLCPLQLLKSPVSLRRLAGHGCPPSSPPPQQPLPLLPPPPPLPLHACCSSRGLVPSHPISPGLSWATLHSPA